MIVVHKKKKKREANRTRTDRLESKVLVRGEKNKLARTATRTRDLAEFRTRTRTANHTTRPFGLVYAYRGAEEFHESDCLVRNVIGFRAYVIVLHANCQSWGCLITQ